MAITEQISDQVPRAGRRVIQTFNLVFGLIIALNLLAVFDAQTGYARTHLAAVALALYLLVETRRYLKRSDTFGLLSPAFLSLLVHFTFSYLLGISVVVFDPQIIERFRYWLPDLDAALAGTLMLALAAAFCMLRGYELGQPLAGSIRRAWQGTSLLRKEIRPNFTLALIIQGVFMGLVALSVSLGIYGFIGTAEARNQYVSILELMRLFLAAGTLSYFLILMRYFKLRKEGAASPLFVLLAFALILLHVMVGFMSGFKSQVVYPFIIAGLAYFVATQRIPGRFIWMSVAALIVAYVVVEPYRNYLSRVDVQGSVGDVIGALATAVEQREHLQRQTDMSTTEQIASRFDLSGMTTLAIDFVHRGDLQQDFRQALQDSILLAPVLAFVPRAIWRNKPSYSSGVWFNQNVLGRWRDNNTSVGMGPIGFLYMAGGAFAVCLGFFVFGVVQAILFDGFARAGAGGLIIYLSVASTLIMIPTSVGPALTGVLRMIPVAFVAQLILLRRDSRPSGS